MVIIKFSGQPIFVTIRINSAKRFRISHSFKCSFCYEPSYSKFDEEIQNLSRTLFSGTCSDILTYLSIVCLRLFHSLKTSFIQPGYEHCHLVLWTLALVFFSDSGSCCRFFLRQKFKQSDAAVISSHLCTPAMCHFKFTRCLQKMRRKTKYFRIILIEWLN